MSYDELDYRDDRVERRPELMGDRREELCPKDAALLLKLNDPTDVSAHG